MSVLEQIGGRGAFSRARKTENRQRLIEAAGQVFERMGYSAASVDDIARAAGVSRQTFYRHFEAKVSIGQALYLELRERTLMVWQEIGGSDAQDQAQVRHWLHRMFAAFRTHGGAIRTFIEMGTVEPAFFEMSKSVVQDLTGLLAERIPAFAGAARPGSAEIRQQVEAWLLVFQIADHSSNAAVGFLNIDLDCLIDVLAANFVSFVERYSQTGAH